MSSLATPISDSMVHDVSVGYFDLHKPSLADATPTPPSLSLDLANPQALESRLVSSISHELRSPLHGALAAVEFLQDSHLDDDQSDLANMIQACATTLLDTLNHLLDYSIIRGNASPHPSVQQTFAESDLFGPVTQTYLCRLVQDTIEGVYFGHASQQAAYTKNRDTPTHAFAGDDRPADQARLVDVCLGDEDSTANRLADDVAVYLDMDSCAAWYTQLRTGAWRRLVMNLFGNALKYTRQGHVEVALKMLTSEDDQKVPIAHLMIKDTGLGMSADFLNHRIYRPFVQEDSLAPGSGLGLSIVKSIVDGLGGSIDVQSTLGVGTRFDVRIPLPAHQLPREIGMLAGGEILDPMALLKGRTLCLLSPFPAEPNVRVRQPTIMHDYVRSIAERWFGMKVIEASMTMEVDADIFIAEASHVVEELALKSTLMASIDKPQTILVGPLPTVGALKHANNLKMGYPLDPKNVCRALLAAVNRPDEPDYPSTPPPTWTTPKKQSGTGPARNKTMVCNELPQMPPAQQRRAQTPTQNSAEHLLLVDDNAINLKLISALAKKLGVSADTAVDGKDAFETYKAALETDRPFTTIFMDVSMPIMDGFESTRAIRAHEAKTNVANPVRIIALTGLGSAAHKKEASTSGMNDYRTKPVAMKTLKELLRV
ncbi:hypothetical protein E4T47_08872 [Aureobasidium subglaciale]|nr:hypothetical protein E4T47_08872 [Aureobasidium subglaciale]